MDAHSQYLQATQATAANLKTIAQSQLVQDLSRLSLPEVEATSERIAEMLPAGNVPGLILSGLINLPGRMVTAERARRDINVLMNSIEKMYDAAVYGTFFAGPVAVLWGYQSLLQLAGKDPQAAFPHGLWQFYVEYALREDSARHANETVGFDKALRDIQARLLPSDRVTAWVMTAIQTLHDYHAWLENEWRERMALHLLAEMTHHLPEAKAIQGLYRRWELERPFARGPEAATNEPFSRYRARQFEAFMAQATASLPADLVARWKNTLAQRAPDLAEYQRQMTIGAVLEPQTYHEVRQPVALSAMQVAVVYKGYYHLIPVCTPDSSHMADVATVRAQVAALMNAPAPLYPPVDLRPLARLKRSHWPTILKKISPDLRESLELLRYVPIIINADPVPGNVPLAVARQAERGLGHQPLTIFDTGNSFIFDQSHIFFDGTWGAALAETMTNEATAWAMAFAFQGPPRFQPAQAPAPLQFRITLADQHILREAPTVLPEASAENTSINIGAMLNLRKSLKRRSDMLDLTVTDLMVLYRAIHAATYRPSEALLAALNAAIAANPKLAEPLADITRPPAYIPSVLIPIDASQHNPRERLHLLNFEVPLDELDFMSGHQRALAALRQYDQSRTDRTIDRNAAWEAFTEARRDYLSILAGFCSVLARAKHRAKTGDNHGLATLRLIANLPPALKTLLEKIPDKFEVLNDLLRGREVFSNLGAVVRTSSLTRFITAKDDNEQKKLAWGVLTSADNRLCLTLRDFRPHVATLQKAGLADLAQAIAQDYVDSYAHGLNRFVRELHLVAATKRGNTSALRR